MRRFVLFFIFILALPAYAQKNLLPAAKAVAGNTVVKDVIRPAVNARLIPGRTVRMAFSKPPVQTAAMRAVKTRKEMGRLSYLPPVQIDVRQMEKLSLAVNRRVALHYASKGLLRTLDEIKVLANNKNAPWDLRVQAQLFVASKITPEQARLFLHFYPFVTTKTEFAIENNTFLLRMLPNFMERTRYIQREHKVIASQLTVTRLDRPYLMTQAIDPQARLIMLGEVHSREGMEEQIAALLQEYQAKYPGRKMVLFTEFLPSRYPQAWQPGQPVPAGFFEKEPGYRKTVLSMAERLGMEIYGLEDVNFTYHTAEKISGLDFVEANISFRSMPMRNRYWERIIRHVMKQHQKTDPDTVFFVYAGNMHIDKSVQLSLSFLLKDQKPFSILFQNGFHGGFLGYLMDQNPSVAAEMPEPYLLRWKRGKYADLIGFDAEVLVPFEKNDLMNR